MRKVADNSVVSIAYVLSDDAGNVLDRSADRGPLSYVHGRREIVPRLERALFGRRVGAKVSVSVSPADGYGCYDETLVFEVPRSEMPPSIVPALGMQLTMSNPSGHQVPVTVLEVKPSSVIMDGNHPFAGKTLHFDIEVKRVQKPRREKASDCCSGGTCTSTPSRW